MATYTIVIDDAMERGITAAREAHNASLEAEVPLEPPNPDTPEAKMPNPQLKADNAAYMQFVMEGAAKSYDSHYPATP